MGNMSALEDSASDPIQENNPPPMSDPVQENTPIGDQSEPTENNPMEATVISKKSTLKSYRQKLQAIQARIKYREKAIKGFRNHLKKGTFPKRFKSLRPFPKMDSPETQAVVNAACEQVHCVILDQMILDEEKKLLQDHDNYQAMKKQRECERSQLLKTSKKPQKLSVTQLMQELTELQSKYAQLYQQLNSTQ